MESEGRDYDIIRNFASGSKRYLHRGVTLQVAQLHCNGPHASSRTCTSAEGKRRTRRSGAWFDGYVRR